MAHQLRQVFPQDEGQRDDGLRGRGVGHELVVDLGGDVDELLGRDRFGDGGAEMPQTILGRLVLLVVVVVFDGGGEEAGAGYEGLVERVQKSSEGLEALLDSKDDAVQHDSIVLHQEKLSFTKRAVQVDLL